MDLYSCGNCGEEKPTLISHPGVTGDNGFDPDCFYLMVNALTDLKKQCPICLCRDGHYKDCIQRKLQDNRGACV